MVLEGEWMPKNLKSLFNYELWPKISKSFPEIDVFEKSIFETEKWKTRRAGAAVMF